MNIHDSIIVLYLFQNDFVLLSWRASRWLREVTQRKSEEMLYKGPDFDIVEDVSWLCLYKKGILGGLKYEYQCLNFNGK